MHWKEYLRDLENVKLLSPDAPDIVYHKRVLREGIAALEKEDSEGHDSRPKSSGYGNCLVRRSATLGRDYTPGGETSPWHAISKGAHFCGKL